MRTFGEAQSKAMRAYAQSGQYHTIVESRVRITVSTSLLLYMTVANISPSCSVFNYLCSSRLSVCNVVGYGVRWYVDGRPIREFKNMETKGVPYPKKQAMRLYASLWDAEEWATRGGLVKTDWTKAPFTASFRSYNANGCVWSDAASWCGQNSTPWLSEALDSGSQKVMRWVRKKYMIYDYCTDQMRFPQGLPRECPVRTNP